MDTLALAVIAMGVVAAIGVVLITMSDGGKESVEGQAQPEATRRPEKVRARPRPRRPQQQATPAYTVASAHRNGHTTGTDPLVEGFMHVVAGELDSLRVQQETIDERLKLINGIAQLIHDMQATSANNNGNHHVSARSNRTAA